MIFVLLFQFSAKHNALQREGHCDFLKKYCIFNCFLSVVEKKYWREYKFTAKEEYRWEKYGWNDYLSL